jgi:hypothetical protein
MATESPDRKVNTDEKVQNDGVKRMPHERDESPDAQDSAPRGVMKQAADDLAQGLVDTDLHGVRGLEQALPKGSQAGQARPQDEAANGMRDQASTTSTQGNKQ